LIALLDADILAYRIAFACKDEKVNAARLRLSSYIIDILALKVDHTYEGCFVDDWKLYITGKGNFREQIAITAPYKGNRTAPKPEHHQAMRDWLLKEWGAILVKGSEADDAIATEATKLGAGNCIMVSVDKDFDQIPGWHYNFVKNIGYYVTEEEGLLSFYKQILTGDDADNIKGIYGVGPAKAGKMLAETYNDELAMWQVCIDAYEGNTDRVIENARLLWLRRYDDELWTPPTLRINNGN
jgi:hypothetical protein